MSTPWTLAHPRQASIQSRMPPDRAGADAAAQAFDAAMASNSLCEEIGAAVSERMLGGKARRGAHAAGSAYEALRHGFLGLRLRRRAVHA